MIRESFKNKKPEKAISESVSPNRRQDLYMFFECFLHFKEMVEAFEKNPSVSKLMNIEALYEDLMEEIEHSLYSFDKDIYESLMSLAQMMHNYIKHKRAK